MICLADLEMRMRSALTEGVKLPRFAHFGGEVCERCIEIKDQILKDVPPCEDLPWTKEVILQCVEEMPMHSYEKILSILFSYLQRARKDVTLAEEPITDITKYSSQLEKHILASEKFDRLQKQMIMAFLEELLSILPPRRLPSRRFSMTVYSATTDLKVQAKAALYFKRGSERAIRGVAKRIQDGVSFQKVWKWLRFQRGLIAKKQCLLAHNTSEEWRKFQSKRTSGIATCLVDYAEYAKAIYRMMRSLRDCGGRAEETREGWTYQIAVDAEYHAQTKLSFDGKEIPLSEYKATLSEEGYLGFSFMLATRGNERNGGPLRPLMIRHTPSYRIADIMPLIKHYFHLAKQSQNEEGFLGNMALFRFFFAHATPNRRGSAAIAEWFEAGMALAVLGKQLQYGERGDYEMSNGDLDVFASTTPSDYIAIYRERIKGK